METAITEQSTENMAFVQYSEHLREPSYLLPPPAERAAARPDRKELYVHVPTRRRASPLRMRGHQGRRAPLLSGGQARVPGTVEPSLQAWVSATSWPSSARTQATISVVGAPGVKILATPIR